MGRGRPESGQQTDTDTETTVFSISKTSPQNTPNKHKAAAVYFDTIQAATFLQQGMRNVELNHH